MVTREPFKVTEDTVGRVLWGHTKHVGFVKTVISWGNTMGSQGTARLLHCGVLKGTMGFWGMTRPRMVESGEHRGGPWAFWGHRDVMRSR